MIVVSVEMNGQPTNISIERLKPSYTAADETPSAEGNTQPEADAGHDVPKRGLESAKESKTPDFNTQPVQTSSGQDPKEIRQYVGPKKKVQFNLERLWTLKIITLYLLFLLFIFYDVQYFYFNFLRGEYYRDIP